MKLVDDVSFVIAARWMLDFECAMSKREAVQRVLVCFVLAAVSRKSGGAIAGIDFDTCESLIADSAGLLMIVGGLKDPIMLPRIVHQFPQQMLQYSQLRQHFPVKMHTSEYTAPLPL